eukprot:11019542-Lingulodinium_polyedra.AAC.1
MSMVHCSHLWFIAAFVQDGAMAVSLECELQALGKCVQDLSTAGHNEEYISAIEDQQVVLLCQKRK